MAFALEDQELLLTYIAFSSLEEARVALSLLDETYYDSIHQKIYRKFKHFISKYKASPQSHLFEIFSDLQKSHEKDAEILARIYDSIRDSWASGLSKNYIFDRAKVYKRTRDYQDFLTQAARLAQREPSAETIEELDELFLKTRQSALELSPIGEALNLKETERVNRALEQDPEDQIYSGIDALDQCGICPTKKQFFVVVAPSGSGKSLHMMQMATHEWWQFTGEKKRHVLYVPLEMEVADEVKRAFRSRGLYTSDVKNLETKQMMFSVDSNGRADPRTIKRETVKLYNDLARRDRMHEKIKERGEFIIWPKQANVLTVSMLETMIRSINAQYGIQLDQCLVDYIRLMKRTRGQEARSDLEENAIGLKQLAKDLNIAMTTAQQVTAEASKAILNGGLSSGADASSDKSIQFHADKLVCYMQTPTEAQHGLARLYVDKGRQVGGKMTIVIAQNYAANRYCVASGKMSVAWEAEALKDKS